MRQSSHRAPPTAPPSNCEGDLWGDLQAVGRETGSLLRLRRTPPIPNPSALPYESGIQVRPAIRRECNLERRVADEIASEIDGQFSAMKRVPLANAETPGLVLGMKIINVEGGVGAARGHKTLTVAGVLYEDGKKIGDFTATRRTKNGRHTCRMLWENIEDIAEDVSRWMQAPTLDAYLGDARPGDFRPLPSSERAAPGQDL